MSTSIITKTVQIPVETLKTIIDDDFRQYMYYQTSFGLEFPTFDATKVILSALKDIGIEFDTKTGQWKD